MNRVSRELDRGGVPFQVVNGQNVSFQNTSQELDRTPTREEALGLGGGYQIQPEYNGPPGLPVED